VPSLKVGDLGAADAEQDAQDFRAGDPLGKLRIEAASALLDKGEVEAGGVGNGLGKVGNIVRLGGVGFHIVVGSGNGGVLVNGQSGDSVGKSVAEVGVKYGTGRG